MTKISENGQLEWTFEELDLEGALLELKNECNELIEINAKLLVKMDKLSLHDLGYTLCSLEFNFNHQRISHLSSVMISIQTIIINGVFGV